MVHCLIVLVSVITTLVNKLTFYLGNIKQSGPFNLPVFQQNKNGQRM